MADQPYPKDQQPVVDAVKQRRGRRRPLLALDFDGVIHGYQSGWQGAAIVPDPPVPGAIEFLHRAVERFQVAIYSSRSGQPGGIDAMKGWLAMHMHAAIDDRGEAEHVLGVNPVAGRQAAGAGDDRRPCHHLHGHVAEPRRDRGLPAVEQEASAWRQRGVIAGPDRRT